METNNLISEVQIVPIKPINGLVGFASLVLDGNFYLGSIAIMTRPQGGYRVTYPTRKVGTKNINTYYPIDKEIAELVEKTIIKHFEEVMNRQHDRHNSISS